MTAKHISRFWLPTYPIKQNLEEEEEKEGDGWKLPVILRMSAICCQRPGDVEPNCEICAILLTLLMM